jgi:ribosomal protein L11 methyltransferase
MGVAVRRRDGKSGEVRLLAVTVHRADAELVADRCWQAGAGGIWEVPGADGTVVLRVGVEDDRVDAVRAVLADRSATDVTDAERFELAAQEVSVGAAGGMVRLVVPPTVFGDGRHPTTATCLAILGELVGPGTRLLDVGCGSGALAVVAARAGATVVAIDLDPTAVRATVANAEANGVVVGASTTPLAAVEGTYDVVVANISAQAVIELAADLWRVCADTGALVPSGILAERWGEVVDRLGGDIAEVHVVDGWVTGVLRR